MNLDILWPKLIAAIFLIILFVSVYRLKRPGALRFLAAGIGILVLRDLLHSYLQVALLIPLSDLLILCLYLLWLRAYTGRRPSDLFFLLGNALVFAAGTAAVFIEVPLQAQFILILILLADVIYLAIALGIVSPYNTENCDIVLRVRFVLIAGFFLAQLIALLYGYQNPILHTLLLPASYLVHAYLLVRYNGLAHETERKSIEFYSTNLEATFEFMENLGNAITAKINLPKVMEIIISSAVHNIGADAGAILMVDEYEDVLNVAATYGIYPPLSAVPDIVRVKTSSLKRHFSETPVPIGETLLGEAVRSGQPIMVRDARQDPRLEHNSRDDILFVSSIIAIPLIVGDRALGVLSTLKRAENQFFTEHDFDHLKTFADYASITIDNLFTYMEVLEKREMDRELDIAAEIQKKLLPATLPDLNKAALAVYNRPAKGVSGDYYDIIRLDRDKVALVVCDVAGKGIPAALVMIMIRSILHLVVSPERDAATILDWVNRGITGRIDLDHFATIGFVIYDQLRREILYANAAHLPLMVYKRASGKLHKVDTEGLPIGIEKGGQYAQKRFGLDGGDMIVLCTDGILEAMNGSGQQYSLKNLRKVIEQHAVLPADELVAAIRGDLERFVGTARQHDDQTLLLMRVN